MEERMLVTQALDERDFLAKKIMDKINAFKAVDFAKHNESKTCGGKKDRTEYEKETKAGYQQIMDLITRYDKIEAAIVASNANTFVETSKGRYTVAAAIALKNRLAASAIPIKNGFEVRLIQRMQKEYNDCIVGMENRNKELERTAEDMRLSILGKDSKTKETKPLEVVEAYVKENKAELVDPLNIEKIIEERTESRNRLLKELETQIKVSNATTFITI